MRYQGIVVVKNLSAGWSSVGCCQFTCYQPSSPLSWVGCLSAHRRPEVASVVFLMPVRSFLCYSRKDIWQLCFSAVQRLWIHSARPLSSCINYRNCYVVVTVEHDARSRELVLPANFSVCRSDATGVWLPNVTVVVIHRGWSNIIFIVILFSL